MNHRLITIFLTVGVILTLAALMPKFETLNLPGNNEGYTPDQPIEFSHLLHAGELDINCHYCHAGAETSRHAGIPSANVCMNCHKFVTSTLAAVREEDKQAEKEKRDPKPVVSDNLQKIYDALALNANMTPDPTKTEKPLAWNKVHTLPDFVYFDHRPHVAAGVKCDRCHGPVETMEKVRQFSDLSMGWCVSCHREAQAEGLSEKPVSTDCSICHF